MYGSLMDVQEQQANNDKSQKSLQNYYCLAEDFYLTCMQMGTKKYARDNLSLTFFLMASIAIINVLTISVQLQPLKNKYSDGMQRVTDIPRERMVN